LAGLPKGFAAVQGHQAALEKGATMAKKKAAKKAKSQKK
jgi:hypothetical protein